MGMARSGVSLVAFRGALFALGGFNGFVRLDSAEKWDPSQGQGSSSCMSRLCNAICPCWKTGLLLFQMRLLTVVINRVLILILINRSLMDSLATHELSEI
jgi:hypothetical protein